MKESDNESKKKIAKNISDVKLFFLSVLFLFLLFISQPETYKPFIQSLNLFPLIVITIKAFVLNWLLPFTTLMVVILTYRNILLTKESITIARESIMVSQDTLKQMQLSDQKNTAPMLNFNLSIGEELITGLSIQNENRPREIILWDAKKEESEKTKPHFLNLSLKNMQEHPQGVAIDVILKIALTLPKCEGGKEICEENLELKYTYMDAKEFYETSIIKISGLPSLRANIVDISYKDMFGQRYVIGYGTGALRMKKDYIGTSFFTSLSGQTPDEPSSASQNKTDTKAKA